MKIGIPAFAGLLIVTGWIAHQVTNSGYATEVGTAPEQPIPFNHQHHIESVGVDCRYCHDAVEKSAFAGLPTTETCMTCHSQIWAASPVLEPVRRSFASGIPIQWTRVTELPDFVYFNHSIHVAKGVKCGDCHGAVEQMPLTWKFRSFYMSDCVDCHRKTAPETAFRITRCTTCHR